MLPPPSPASPQCCPPPWGRQFLMSPPYPPGRPAGRDKGAGEGGQQAAIEMLPDVVRRWQGRSRTSIPRLPAHRERGKTLGFSPAPSPGVYHRAERHKSTWLCKANNWPVLKHKAQDRLPALRTPRSYGDSAVPCCLRYVHQATKQEVRMD